jgi:hypothetical protein
MASRNLPPPRNLDRAIESSSTLAGLLSGHRRSQACMRTVRNALPHPLHELVRAGPIEEGVWTLFAQHAAAAAKLRQILPNLLEGLRAIAPDIKEIRVKILPRSA